MQSQHPRSKRMATSTFKGHTRSAFGFFIGYHSSASYKLWDFKRKCFVITWNVQFEETQFPKASDYGEPPADPYDHSRQRQHQSLSPLHEPKLNRPIYDEIVILPS